MRAHTFVDTIVLQKDEFLDVYDIAKKKERDIFAEFINSVDFIKNMPEHKKILTVNMLTRQQFKKGQMIYKQGDDPQFFYFLKQGKVAI